MAVPRKVSLGETHVAIEWSDGHKWLSPNGRLREACPCAMCAGEPAAAPAGIAATKYTMVGRYAIAFAWSDGHSTGIYPYEYLLEMCECESCAAKQGRLNPSKGGLIQEQ